MENWRCGWGRQSAGAADRDLLVLTDADCRGRHVLALPFESATVVELTSDDRELTVVGHFDTIAVDHRALDLDWLDAVTAWVRSVLRPHGHLVVALGSFDEVRHCPAEVDQTQHPPLSLAGFEWCGLRALNGRPCAVLRPVNGPSDSVPTSVGALLAAAHTAVRLAGGDVVGGRPGQRSDRPGQRSDRPGPAGDRREQERLRRQVEALAAELDQVRREHRGVRLVRTVLRRSAPGRGLLRFLGPGWRLAIRVRSRI